MNHFSRVAPVQRGRLHFVGLIVLVFVLCVVGIAALPAAGSEASNLPRREGINAQPAIPDAQKYVFDNKWGIGGKDPGEFRAPLGIAYAADSENSTTFFVYVADSNNDRIQKFKPDGSFVDEWTLDKGCKEPFGIAVSPKSGDVFVTALGGHCVQRYSQDGEWEDGWGGKGTGKTKFNEPRGITVDGNGQVFVADTYNHRVLQFNENGKWKKTFGTGFGTGQSQFAYPYGVAVYNVPEQADKDWLFVADTSNHRIVRYLKTDPTHPDKIWGTQGAGDGQFVYPRLITTDGVGNVYVADEGNNRVQKFSKDGKFKTKFGTRKFKSPYGVAVDAIGDVVYVTDTGHNRVQVFTRVVTEPN